MLFFQKTLSKIALLIEFGDVNKQEKKKKCYLETIITYNSRSDSFIREKKNLFQIISINLPASVFNDKKLNR